MKKTKPPEESRYFCAVKPAGSKGIRLLRPSFVKKEDALAARTNGMEGWAPEATAVYRVTYGKVPEHIAGPRL